MNTLARLKFIFYKIFNYLVYEKPNTSTSFFSNLIILSQRCFALFNSFLTLIFSTNVDYSFMPFNLLFVANFSQKATQSIKGLTHSSNNCSSVSLRKLLLNSCTNYRFFILFSNWWIMPQNKSLSIHTNQKSSNKTTSFKNFSFINNFLF